MKSFKILIAGLLFFCSCRAINSADQPKLEDTQWQLIAMDKKPTDIGDRATIKFNDKDRKATGKAACNSFFADYELLGNNKLSFSNVGSTKMFCEGMMDKENQIITNLQKAKRYEIKYGLLYLYDDDLLLTYKKVNVTN